MKFKHLIIFTSVLVALIACNSKKTTNSVEAEAVEQTENILPSWNEGQTKTSIMDYVNEVTDKNSPLFIPEADRIATFDNDGNLWAEQPAYFQLYFAIDQVKALAPQHPEWKYTQPFKAVLDNDMNTLMEQGERGLLKLVMATHSNNTTEEFDSIVSKWIRTAKHPTKNVNYDKLIYQPMLELLDYLRVNNFKTYIVSGGGVDFMRAFVSPIYGISSEQIIGSRVKTEYHYNDGNPTIERLPTLDFINDKEGKTLNIQKIIGKKPVFSSGNSDGDLEMMQWTASNQNKNFILYLHHTDSVREWAYDKDSHIGRLDKGLEQAKQKGWTVIDMKKDWKVIFPFEM